MRKERNDAFLVNLEEAKIELGVDFITVTDTFFDERIIRFAYLMENHEYDLDLAVTLGLGIIKSDDGQMTLLYNADDYIGSDRMIGEVLRVGVYYQITHPDYDDKDLEKTVIKTKGGKEFLKMIQTNDSDEPYERLKSVFDSKKGNVVKFPKAK